MLTGNRFDETRRLQRLVPPTGRVRAVLDTDTYNEIDDQFAVAYAALAGDRIDLQAITAAPFHNSRSAGPEDGMVRSYEEILRLLERLGRQPDGLVCRGSTSWLPDAQTPVSSDAASRIVELAMESDDPLYVLAIGAITNVASAILLDPRIAERIVVVWLGGHPQGWHSAAEFNLKQDLHASRLVLDCGVPLVRIPCKYVAELLQTTVSEVEQYVRGRGAIGDYLADIFREFVGDATARSKVIWDIAAVAWVLNGDWVHTELVHSPVLTDQLTWSVDRRRHFVRESVHCARDAIFGDLFARIEAAAKA